MIKRVLQSAADRPYVQAWLKRVGRQLRGSGKVSQVAMALSIQHGGSTEDWSRELRGILAGKHQPGASLIADIDQILSKPGDSKSARTEEGIPAPSQGLLF